MPSSDAIPTDTPSPVHSNGAAGPGKGGLMFRTSLSLGRVEPKRGEGQFGLRKDSVS